MRTQPGGSAGAQAAPAGMAAHCRDRARAVKCSSARLSKDKGRDFLTPGGPLCCRMCSEGTQCIHEAESHHELSHTAMLEPVQGVSEAQAVIEQTHSKRSP